MKHEDLCVPLCRFLFMLGVTSQILFAVYSFGEFYINGSNNLFNPIRTKGLSADQ